MIQRHSLYFALLALLVDVATFITLRLASPRLVARLSSPGGWNALLVAGVFLLFAAGVFLFRRLKAMPPGSAEWSSRGVRVALALAFALVISLALAWQLGFFASSSQVDTTEMGEGGSASYFVFGPGAWLAFSLIYVLVFGFNVEPSIEPEGTGYGTAALLGLLAAAAMLLVLAAQAQAIMQVVGAAWWAWLTLLILAVLFLPPRLLYLSRTVGVRTPPAYGVIAGQLLLLAAVAWQVASVG